MSAFKRFSLKKGVYSLGFFVLALSISTNTFAQYPYPKVTGERSDVVLEGKKDMFVNPFMYPGPIDIWLKPGTDITTTHPPWGKRNSVPSVVNLFRSTSTAINDGYIHSNGFMSTSVSMVGNDMHFVNRGSLESDNRLGFSVWVMGDDHTVFNAPGAVMVGLNATETFTLTGRNNRGIFYGTVIAEPSAEFPTEEVLAIGLGSAVFISEEINGLRGSVPSSGNTVDIYGNVYGVGPWGQSLGIWQGDNQSFTIHEGAMLFGHISNHAGLNRHFPSINRYAYGKNNGLKIDQGPETSYVYQYIGKWDYINDLDGRPVVAGNETDTAVPFYNRVLDVCKACYLSGTVEVPVGDIMAVSVGGLEIMDEGQFSRVTMVNNALLNQDYQRNNARRRLRNRRYNALKGRFQPWAQSSYTASSRDNDPSDLTVLGYEEKSQGVIAGLPMRVFGKSLDFIVNVGQGDVNIEDGSHTITSIDTRVGVYLPRFFKFRVGRYKAEVSGKALVGYTRRKTQRDVLTNVNTTPGIVKYEGTSSAFDIQVGATSKTEIRFGSRTSVSLRAGLDIAYDLIAAYSEKENGQWFSSEYADRASFDWRPRHLLQGIAKASSGIQYRATRRLAVHGIASATARQVLIGRAQYTLGGVDTSFKGGNSKALIGELNLGATYRLGRRIRIGASAQTMAGSDGVTGYSAGAFLDWRFSR